MGKNTTRDPIPQFETLEEIAGFWDTHSTADYDDLTREVEFEVSLRKRGDSVQGIMLLPELSKTLEALAKARGVSLETLVNVWLTEKVLEQSR